ncbi:helix-turn-helix domain-containing protein [Ornithinibacillus halophilus]|uniref:helix-turn-helix domain-containing protein n=1 Tax=Ornithinibacillus halophilus TaxID=930117 RepID=UPI001F203C6F|nr:helix-turn-helix transcriptional regulator [Ornithinibacillus halophilus]
MKIKIWEWWLLSGLGDRLRKLRLERGLEPEKMAQQLQFTKSVIWSYELEKKEPSVSHIKRLADFFDVSTDYLVNGIEEKQPTLQIDLENRNKNRHRLLIDGVELSEEELTDVVAFIKAKRLLKK